tara:strand:- start:3281 stop:4108 length:828 start_codon:yes stop_codon:yes gene_type:complete
MIKLLNGDCLTLMKDLSDNSIDILIVDLPYGNTTSCKWDIQIDIVEYWKQINRICKPDAPMFFFCNTKFGNTLINSNPKNFRYEYVYIKNQATGFLNAKKMPMKKVEYVYVFYNKLSKVYTENITKYHKHKFIKERVNNRNEKDGINNKHAIKNRSKTETINKYDPKLPENVITENTIYNTHTRNRDTELTYDPTLPDNVLEYNSDKGKHPTQKPVELIKWILKYYTRPNDTCLDTTMGSGSTGVACKEMNINFIGMELDKDYFNVAKDRINMSN